MMLVTPQLQKRLHGLVVAYKPAQIIFALMGITLLYYEKYKFRCRRKNCTKNYFLC